MVERLEHQDAGAVPHHEAVALRVERARGSRRVVVALRGQGAHGAEGGDRDLADARLGTAGDHDVRVPTANDVHRVADGVVRARAGADRRVVRAARVRVDRDVSGGHVRDQRGDQEGTDPLHAVQRGLGHVANHGVDAADPGADDAAGPPGKRLVADRVLEAGVAHRLGDRGPRVVDVAIVAAHFLLRHHRVGVEALDLARDLAGHLRRIEAGDPRDAAPAVDEPVPEGRHVVADRREGAHAGDDDAALSVTHRAVPRPSPGRAG